MKKNKTHYIELSDILITDRHKYTLHSKPAPETDAGYVFELVNEEDAGFTIKTNSYSPDKLLEEALKLLGFSI